MEAPQKFLQAGAGDSAHVVELDAHTSPRIGVAHDTVDAHFSFGERKEEFYGCAGGRGHVGGDESTAGTQIAHARDAARSIGLPGNPNSGGSSDARRAPLLARPGMAHVPVSYMNQVTDE